ncbi:hypothetical protein JZU68_03480, partial [bacterium]|nr:hypothetical protein [bacterium]
PTSRIAFRKLCLLSAKAVLRGHMSRDLEIKPDWAFWMRDEFLAGIEPYDPAEAKKYPSEGLLCETFTEFYKNSTLQKAVAEKQESALIWEKIVTLSKQVKSNQSKDDAYIRVSSLYGLYLHRIIASGWQIMALGFEGDKTGNYNKKAMQKSIKTYDKAWKAFNKLKQTEPSCATLYKPNAFIYVAPSYYAQKGMGFSVEKYRRILK